MLLNYMATISISTREDSRRYPYSGEKRAFCRLYMPERDGYPAPHALSVRDHQQLTQTMSTRSHIGIWNEDGSLDVIYCLKNH